ncbi:MAG: DUF3829 domain-containing protein [Polyangiaceae bacterium]
MKKLNVALLGAVLVAFPLTGCSKLKAAQKAAEALKAAAAAASNKASDNGTAEAAKPADPELEKDSDLGEKLGEYIECLNYASKSVHDSRRRYLDWTNEKTGPTGKERHVYGLYEVRGDDCLKAIDKAKTLKPQLAEIESNAEEYKAALQALTPLIAAAQKYYSQQDYKDDKMAKGKEMHGPLIAAFTKFESANQGFESKVTKMNDELGARMLERMSKDPSMRLQYLTKKSLADAKALILLADVGTLKDLDLAKIEAAVQTYDKSDHGARGLLRGSKGRVRQGQHALEHVA